MIELATSDGHSFSAYRADPAAAPKGAVVVLQDEYGVGPHLQKVADAFAAQGYVAIAPSLFDRVTRGASFGHDDTGLADGTAAAGQIETAQALADIQTAVDAVKTVGKVAVVGFSWGGDLAYAAANCVSGIACVIGYGGSGTVNAYQEKRKVPTLVHFGESDALIPSEQIAQFRAHRPDVSAFTYPGAAHGFDCAESEGFQPKAAAAAQERTLFWIAQYVEGQPPVQLKNAGAYAQAKTDRKKKKASGGDLGPPMD
jgi:carboxymethylenebutenolidase